MGGTGWAAESVSGNNKSYPVSRTITVSIGRIVRGGKGGGGGVELLNTLAHFRVRWAFEQGAGKAGGGGKKGFQ